MHDLRHTFTSERARVDGYRSTTHLDGTYKCEILPREAYHADLRIFMDWGVWYVMDDLTEKTGIDLDSHRRRYIFATNLIVKYELDPSLAMKLTRHRDVRSFRRYTNRKN